MVVLMVVLMVEAEVGFLAIEADDSIAVAIVMVEAEVEFQVDEGDEGQEPGEVVILVVLCWDKRHE